ncbi:MAG: hypothetical protein IPN01_18435 [Deltaproteobacteria bacterium]|nr:hypothetical protein [Deltaproteobacteria bacterium]
MAHDAMQCGFCTPLRDGGRGVYGPLAGGAGATEPSDAENSLEALAGHVCRCGAQVGTRAAIRDACAGRFDGPGEGGPPLRRPGQGHRRRKIHRGRDAPGDVGRQVSAGGCAPRRGGLH